MLYFKIFIINNADRLKMFITELAKNHNNWVTKLQVQAKEFRTNPKFMDQIQT